MAGNFFNKHFVVLMGNGVTSIIGLAMMYIILHNLSVEHAGLWFLLQSFVGFCEAGRYGLLATATVKFYAGTTGDRSATVLGSVWFLALALSALILLIDALAFLYLPFTNNYEVILCVKWIGINYLSSLPSDVVFWRLQADEEYTKMFWFRMINACSTLASFIVLVVLHQFTLENVIIWNLLTNCSSSLIGIIWYRSGIQYVTRRTKECVAEIFHFGKFTFGTTQLSSLLGNADIWILNFVLGPVSITLYNMAMKLMAFVELPLRSFTTTGFPEMAIAYNQNNLHHVGYLFKKYSGMLSIVFIPAAVVTYFVAPTLMHLLGGHKYNGYTGHLAANVFRLTMVLAIIYPIDRFNGLALDVTGYAKTNFYKMIIVICIKLVFGLLLVEVLKNLYGIVIANYISTIVAIIYGSYRLRKTVPHTITGVFSTGFAELLNLKNSISFRKNKN